MAWLNAAFSFGVFNVSCSFTVSCICVCVCVCSFLLALPYADLCAGGQIDVVLGTRYVQTGVRRLAAGNVLASSLLDEASGEAFVPLTELLWLCVCLTLFPFTCRLGAGGL
jgi:hypothetical protein